MLSIFKKGLVFGLGFSVSVLFVIYIFMFSGIFENKPLENIYTEKSLSTENMTVEEKINLATEIYVTKYEDNGTNFVKCIVTEVLKSTDKESPKYSVGDTCNESSYYKGENVVYGDGNIIFYFGGYGSAKSSYSYSGNRVGGLNNITLELLREKAGH